MVHLELNFINDVKEGYNLFFLLYGSTIIPASFIKMTAVFRLFSIDIFVIYPVPICASCASRIRIVFLVNWPT